MHERASISLKGKKILNLVYYLEPAAEFWSHGLDKNWNYALADLICTSSQRAKLG